MFTSVLKSSLRLCRRATSTYQHPVLKNTKAMPNSLYGGRHTVTMMTSSGVGPEVLAHVRRIFAHLNVPVDFELHKLNNPGDLEDALISVRRNGVCLKSHIERSSIDKLSYSRTVYIRNELNLFALVLHCRSWPGVPAIHTGVDIIIIRHTIEGEYAMLEHELVPGYVESLKIISKENVRKIAKFTMEYARRNKRKKITVVHKANIMKKSDGLFRQVVFDVAKEYPDLEVNDMIVDNCTMQLVSKPQQFDVMLTPNLYGNVVSSVICGLTGGAGLMSAKNYGDHCAVFETGARSVGTAIVGQNKANPVALISASADMLNYLGLNDYACMIRCATARALEDGYHTGDLGGKYSTSDLIDRILCYIES